jgi:hypothetical protein
MVFESYRGKGRCGSGILMGGGEVTARCFSDDAPGNRTWHRTTGGWG